MTVQQVGGRTKIRNLTAGQLLLPVSNIGAAVDHQPHSAPALHHQKFDRRDGRSKQLQLRPGGLILRDGTRLVNFLG